MTVPDIRIQVLNASPVNGEGEFILYWMIAYRRLHWNFALQRAAQWARELCKPLDQVTSQEVFVFAHGVGPSPSGAFWPSFQRSPQGCVTAPSSSH